MVKIGTDLIKVGIIGGTGIYNPSMFDNARTVEVDTPFCWSGKQ